MTDREPDLQRAIDDATDRCARHLTGRILPGIDPKILATAIVEGLYDHDWRPIPRPAPLRKPGSGTPANERFQQALAQLRGEPTE